MNMTGMAVSAAQRQEQSKLALQALVAFVKVVWQITEENDNICSFSEEHARQSRPRWLALVQVLSPRCRSTYRSLETRIANRETC